MPDSRWVRDFFGPEHDSPLGRRSPQRLAYAVCSTPRSGSGLLCRGLSATGQLGTPLEYLNPVLREQLARRWRCRSGLEEYVSALRARRTGANGVFGIKLHWAQLEAAAAEGGVEPHELLELVAPTGRRVLMQRRDRVAQAVSYWRAERSGVWSLTAGASYADATSYDFAGIAACGDEVARGERAWLGLAGAEPAAVVEYEELASDYAVTLRHVATALGATVAVVPPPRTRRLADERSAELAERFRSELDAARP